MLTIGSVNDIFSEKNRDCIEWKEQATHADMDRVYIYEKIAESAKIS